LIAACNPYKFRKTEVSGMTPGYKISEDDTYSKLVYRVFEMPDSLVPFIWDYKSLEDLEEF